MGATKKDGNRSFLVLTARGARLASLLRLADADLICLARTYRAIGLLAPSPDFLERTVLAQAIVAAEMGPHLRLTEGRAA